MLVRINLKQLNVHFLASLVDQTKTYVFLIFGQQAFRDLEYIMPDEQIQPDMQKWIIRSI